MSVNFFKDIQLKQSEVSGNYRLHKIGQLYDEIQQLENDKPYSTVIENPVDIASDFVCGWYDPSNTNLMSLTAGTNTLVNNASGYALYDKSNYNNNLNIVAGGSGIEYDPVKRMLHHSGGSVASILQNTTLSAKQANHFTTPASAFSFFIVAECESGWSGGSLRILCQVGGVDNIGFISDTDRNNMRWQNNNFGTNVVHPTTSNYFYGKRFIYGIVCGTDNVGFYRDMYYNGIWVGRQRTGTGGSRNGSLHIGHENTISFTSGRWEGWIGESVLISRDLSRLEAVKICDYLNSKWNVYPVRECDIFVYGGQSNAVDSSNNTGVSSLMNTGGEYGFYCDPEYFYIANESPIVCMRGSSQGSISYYLPTNTTTPTTVLASAGSNIGSFGCWAELAQQYFLKTGRYSIFVGCAVNGSSMFQNAQWAPSNANNNLWANVKNVLPLLKEKLAYNGWNVKTSNFCWIQGETDRNQNKNDYLTRFNQGLELTVNQYGYDNAFYWIITSRQAEGFGGNARTAQLEYNPLNPKIRCAFDLGLFTDTRLNLYQDNFHPNGLGSRISGEESGKQIGEIIAKDQTLTLKSIVSVEQPTSIYSTEDVRYWGAVGNGINDDTESIQNCINANNSRIYIPQGTYLVGTIGSGNTGCQFTNKNNFTIESDNAQINYLGNGVCINLQTCNNINFNGNLRLRPQANGATVLQLFSCGNVNVRNVDISGINSFTSGTLNRPNTCINISGTTPINSTNFIQNCILSTCSVGININTRNVIVSNCFIQRCSNAGVYITTTGSNSTITSCNFTQNCKAIYVNGTTDDRVSITSCKLYSNVFFGIHLRQINSSVLIDGCDIHDTSGDTFSSGYTLGTSTTEPLNIYNPPALVGTNTIRTYGIAIEGAVGVCVSNSSLLRNVYNIAYAGCGLSTFDGNIFLTGGIVGAFTAGHITEYFDVYGGLAGYSNSRNTICNNTFRGNYVDNPSILLQKAIQFYTTAGATSISIEYKVYNNTTTTGTSEFVFSNSLPDNNTYIIDPNYDSISIVLEDPGPNRLLQLSTAMFGTTFTINAIDAGTAYDNINIQITTNYTTTTDIPIINCAGISYNGTTRIYTISSSGEFVFSNFVSGNNNYTITNARNPVMSLRQGIITNLSVSRSGLDHFNLLDNSSAVRVIDFLSVSSANFPLQMRGYMFYFMGTSSANNLEIDNNSGGVITLIRGGGAPVSIASGSPNHSITGNDCFHTHMCVFIWNGTAGQPTWNIYQL